jgi:hypothetical protein
MPPPPSYGRRAGSTSSRGASRGPAAASGMPEIEISVSSLFCVCIEVSFTPLWGLFWVSFDSCADHRYVNMPVSVGLFCSVAGLFVGLFRHRSICRSLLVS